jgi:predicted RNA-binding protein with PUA-like domain
MPHQYYLAKTDPETYSLEDFAREKRTIWDGVRNAQALQAIRKMKKNDRVFIYHSMSDAAVVGLASALEDSRPDAKDPKLAVIELLYTCSFEPPVTLREIKESNLFDDWALVRQSRLSTMAAPEAFVIWMRKRFPKIAI